MSALVRFGLRLPTAISGGAGTSPLPRLVELARAAEQSGFDSLWVADRPGEDDGSVGELEAYTLLGALATSTSMSRLGALASPAGARPPSLLAKQVTALDVISGGRAVLGMRAARGVHRGRYARLQEAASLCRAMFEHAESTLHGRWYRIEQAANRPPPVRAGGPPLVVAGRGGRRLLEVAVRVADGVHVEASTSRLARLVPQVRERQQRNGKPSHELWVTAGLTLSRGAWSSAGAPAVVEAVGRLLEAGAQGVVLDAPVGVRPDAVTGVGHALLKAYGAAGAA